MLRLNFDITHTVLIYIYVHTLNNVRREGVRTSNIQLYKIIVRCEQRDGPPRPSAHHVTGRLKKNICLSSECSNENAILHRLI